MILDKIVENKKREVEKNGEFYKGLAKKIPTPGVGIPTPGVGNGEIALIAEIKRFSPTNPEPIKGFDPLTIAHIYESNGASALSILTDRDYFGGGFEILESVKNSVEIPVLCKDFIIDESQIYAARYYGADAILLIVRILKNNELKKFLRLADSLGMSSLVEVHCRDELEIALDSGARIIGVNNRDLDTLEVHLDTTLELIKFIPKDKIVVSESGIKTSEDVLNLKNAGVNAILVGEALLRSSDIAAKIKELQLKNLKIT